LALISSTLASGIAVMISAILGMSFCKILTVKESISRMLSNGT
jgi:hypothetical protein